MKGWQRDAMRHAIDEQPNEACGLVVDGKYMPARNMAAHPERFFDMHPDDIVAAYQAGTVQAVFHSHVNISANPSDWDRAQCEKTGLPWYIIGLPSLVWKTCQPDGYQMPLEGRPFIHGLVDCWTLVQDTYRERFGVSLKEYARSDGWWDRGEDLYRRNYDNAGFTTRVCTGPPTDLTQLREGDMIVMRVGSEEPNHAGVYLGDGTIIHHPPDRLSRIDPYGGYWLNTTADVMRHEEVARNATN